MPTVCDTGTIRCELHVNLGDGATIIVNDEVISLSDLLQTMLERISALEDEVKELKYSPHGTEYQKALEDFEQNKTS